MRLSVASLRRVVKRDLPIEFVRQELTSYGGLELLRRYLQRVDLPGRLGVLCVEERLLSPRLRLSLRLSLRFRCRPERFETPLQVVDSQLTIIGAYYQHCGLILQEHPRRV